MSKSWYSSPNVNSDERYVYSKYIMKSLHICRSSATINILLATNILLSGLSFERMQVLSEQLFANLFFSSFKHPIIKANSFKGVLCPCWLRFHRKNLLLQVHEKLCVQDCLVIHLICRPAVNSILFRAYWLAHQAEVICIIRVRHFIRFCENVNLKPF